MSITPRLPSPNKAIKTHLIYYVVIQCSSCKHNYFFPARITTDHDTLSYERLEECIQGIPRKIESGCPRCEHKNKQDSAKRAVLAIGMPDKTGSILCDFSIRNGQVSKKRFRFEEGIEPIHFFKENKDYFRTGPPEGSPSDVDDELMLACFQRVLNPRDTWKKLFRQAILAGAGFSKIAEGVFCFVSQSKEPEVIEQQMQELATEEFWELFDSYAFTKRRLLGVDLWSEKEIGLAGLQGKTYRDWLASDLLEKLQAQELHARVFTIEHMSENIFFDAAQYLGLAVDEVMPPGQSRPQHWIRNEQGFSRKMPAIELLELVAIYSGRSISDQIWHTTSLLAASLEKDEQFTAKLQAYLPPSFSLQWEELGKVSLLENGRLTQTFPLGTVSDSVDIEDEEAFLCFVTWLTSNGKSKATRFIGKHVVSANHFNEIAASHQQDVNYMVYKPLHDNNLVEIYTDETVVSSDEEQEKEVFYGIKRFQQNSIVAEEHFQASRAKQHFVLKYFVKRNFLRFPQFLVAVGEGASSLALDGGLLRGFIQACKVKMGTTVRVFAPFNGVLVISKVEIEEQKIEQYAYDVARQIPEVELKMDRLGFEDVVELEDIGLGSFELLSVQ